MSNTATVDRRSDLVRLVCEAMDEVLDLGVSVAHPSLPDDELGALAQAEIACQVNVQAMPSVPTRHEAQASLPALDLAGWSRRAHRQA